MPTIQAFLLEGAGDVAKQRLISALTSAVVTAVDAPVDSVRIFLTEIVAADFGVGGAPCRAGTQQVFMQAFLIAGRTVKQKRCLIAALTDAAVGSLDLDAALVRVIVTDVPNTDFGLAGQTAAALGRGVGRAAMHGRAESI
jgi:4-oxalocrotonate tautomerase family enzyme